MPGHMGSVKVTTQNLEVVRVDAENNLLLVKGAVPLSLIHIWTRNRTYQ